MELCRKEDIGGIISRYPVRESGILNALAIGLRFAGRADYEAAVLHRVSIDDTLRESLCAKLGDLAAKLA